jgi:PAS domain S-box-containing protein
MSEEGHAKGPERNAVERPAPVGSAPDTPAILEDPGWLRQLFDRALDGVAVADTRDRRFVTANQAFCRMVGYSLDEVRALSVRDIHPADQLPTVIDQFEKQVAGLLGLAKDIPVLRKDGSVFYADVNSSVVVSDGRSYLLGIFRDVSERRIAEAALRRREQLLSESQRIARIGSWFYAMAGPILWSDEMYRIYGVSPDTFTPTEESFFGLIHPDDRPAMQAWMAACGAGAKPGDLEFRIVRPDGTVRFISGRGEAMRDTGGRPIHMAGTAQDITERKRAENDLQRRTEELAALNALTREVSLSQSLEAVAAAALRGMREAIRADRAFLFLREGERLIPCGIEPASSREWLGQIPEHRVGECLCGLAVRSGEPVYSRDILSDRRCAWEECKKAGFRSFAALPLRNEEKIVGVIGLASVTERDFAGQGQFLETLASAVSVSLQNARMLAETKRIAQAIEREKRFSNSIIEGLPGVFYLFDEKGRFLRWNRNLETVSGYSAEEFARLHPLDLFSGPDRDLVASRIAKVFAEGAADVEAELVFKDGRRAHYYFTGFRVVFDETPCLIGLGLDVTERLQMEQRLRQSEKLTAIGQLAGGIAHDFNNQLAGVMGYADLLLNRLTDSALKSHARGIAVSARRAADLTQQLLAFSRKGKYQSVPVDVHRLLGEVAAILERSIDKRIRIERALNAGHATVLGDPTQLQNAFLNLALNARDAMPAGGELTFETDVTAMDEESCRKNPDEVAPGVYLRVCVTDTGRGMTDEVKKHLFEPFFTTKKVGEGTGMGLASVYGTVRSHRGFIGVYSEVDHGTIIRICLPLAPGAVMAEEETPRVEPARGTARLLLVDDEKTVREMGAALLRELGYGVVTCHDGREAVEYYQENWRQVDLVILDMVMPRMGGHETFLALRQINPQVRVLLSSGYSLNGEAHAILREGVLGFIGKPYRLSELARKVAEALAE